MQRCMRQLLTTRTAQLTRCLSTPAIVANMPPCDFVPAKYTGMSNEQMSKIRAENINPAYALLYKNPIYFQQGHMQYLYDTDGNRYLDLIAGIATVSVGHCHPKVNEVLKRQMDRLWHTSNIYYHPAIHEYAEKLVAKFPDPLKVVFFTNSGSEANDLGLFMARLYTGCMDTIVLRGAYHGASPTTMGMTALSSWYYNYPSATSIHKIRNADPYGGIWGGKACRDSLIQPDRDCSCQPGKCEASERYLEEVNDVLTFCSPENKMGLFAHESIQGNAGVMQFPKGYIKEAYAAVRAKGGVCLADEVQTGFGRTGEHFWGFQGNDAVPDIVSMAKGIGNGFPLAAVITTKEIASVMRRSRHFNTFGGNPLACTVGSAVLDVIEEEKLQENAQEVGSFILLELAKLRDEFEIVGDVRGKGLMLGLELVADKKTRKALPTEDFLNIVEDLKDMRILTGLGGHRNNVIRVKPPMCITKADGEYAVACFKKAFQNHLDRKASRV
ncbi:alanine--glyoxylate aminotransferase 2, mitochondrial-like [Watersipora subatra]|uniref:alanine--glyoxylate aminotransferase 2, mitochondrial-like n=1 Tax=Watersipora subatra TaxID=2589382 RepID=UPI00355B6254